MIISVNAENMFGKIEHTFIIKISGKFRYREKYLNTIKVIFHKLTVSMKNLKLSLQDKEEEQNFPSCPICSTQYRKS